jgi:hypothetical protein
METIFKKRYKIDRKGPKKSKEIDKIVERLRL